MRSITDGLIGVITQQRYRVEVWKTSAPKLAVSDEWWVYITKIHHNGEVCEKSIGLPESDLPELITLLTKSTRNN
jgi:hypothetical protein